MPIPNKTMHSPANKVTAITKFSHSRERAHQQARNVGAALDAIAKATGQPRLQLDSPVGQAIVKKLGAKRAMQPDTQRDKERAAIVAACNRVIAAGQKR
jgi:hypothetical protein